MNWTVIGVTALIVLILSVVIDVATGDNWWKNLT